MIAPNDFVSVISPKCHLSRSLVDNIKTGLCRFVFHLRLLLISTLSFISRQQITNPKYIVSFADVQHTHGLISTSIGLSMRIGAQFFQDGVLRIKCVASISPILWSGNRETVIQQQGLQQFEIPLPSIDTREVLFLGESCSAILRSKASENVRFGVLKIPQEISSTDTSVTPCPTLIQSFLSSSFIHSKIERNYNQINSSTANCKHFVTQICLSMKLLDDRRRRNVSIPLRRCAKGRGGGKGK